MYYDKGNIEEFRNVWQTKTLPAIKESIISELSFNTYIKTANPVYMNNNEIVFEVSNEFIKEIIYKKFYDLIKNAVDLSDYKNYKLTFCLKDELTNHMAESRQEDSDDWEPQSMLNPKYTFDKFVVGPSNDLAYAASVAVSQQPGKAYNPFFMYGGSGLGKTHLMQAIGHEILSRDAKAKVLYINSETFANEYINSLPDRTIDKFIRKYRSIDVLMIDDIQFLAGKERTQEAFFHTFNHLYNLNKQIVISSDKPPKDLNPLEERLRTRFEQGLIADIQKPDLEIRIAILRQKSEQENLNLDDEIIYLLANNIQSNIRDLEGALTKLVALSTLTNSVITKEFTLEALKEFITNAKKVDINETTILDAISRYFDVDKKSLLSKKRTRDVAYPRQLAMYLCKQYTDASLAAIGNFFGGRDHTTVMHAVEKIRSDLETNLETKKAVRDILEDFNIKPE
ncbi:MAG: chromosomal replication initiator protein DnaA [Clostridiaceae bacterium]|jgi:chromosomal replication initiator protein|nr:chromosomal replication initiator protein DnaA [Clostridiaceae bacterium]